MFLNILRISAPGGAEYSLYSDDIGMIVLFFKSCNRRFGIF